MGAAPDLRTFLVATPFFGGLDDRALDRIMSMLVQRTFPVGSIVFREGEPGRAMYIVHEGDLVVLKKGESGRTVRMARFGPGDFFGEMTLIEMQDRSATVVVEHPAVLYELTAMNLYALYKADVNAYVMVLQNINRELCRRLRRADERITQVADETGDRMTQIRIRIPPRE
jgi:CRP-like cAMP-binding protein